MLDIFERGRIENLISSLKGASHKVVNRAIDPETGNCPPDNLLLSVQMTQSSLDLFIELLEEKLK